MFLVIANPSRVRIEDVFKAASKCAVILGDINLPEVDFISLNSRAYPGTNLTRSSTLLERIEDGGFEQLVEFPTRLPIITRVENGEFAHIPVHDVVCSNVEGLVQNVEAVRSVGSSDHIAVVFELNLKAKSTSQQLLYDYRKADWSGMEARLSTWMASFAARSACKTADECSRDLTEAIKNAESECIPKKLRRADRGCTWIDKKVKSACREKRKSFIHLRKSRANKLYVHTS